MLLKLSEWNQHTEVNKALKKCSLMTPKGFHWTVDGVLIRGVVEGEAYNLYEVESVTTDVLGKRYVAKTN